MLAGPDPQPKAEEIYPFTQAEIDLVAEELGPRYGPAVVFASETGMRPSEWLAIEWRDVDRKAGVMLVERTCAYGVTKNYGKAARSRRRVPLSTRAIDALDATPRRLDVRLVVPGRRGGVIDLKNFRRAHWKPALDAAGIPSRWMYDMRHSFATWALDAGLSIFELARYMGTSVEMIDTRPTKDVQTPPRRQKEGQHDDGENIRRCAPLGERRAGGGLRGIE